jgi:hypothetical protein
MKVFFLIIWNRFDHWEYYLVLVNSEGSGVCRLYDARNAKILLSVVVRWPICLSI